MSKLLYDHELQEKPHNLKSKQQCMSLVRLINRMARNAVMVSKEVEVTPISSPPRPNIQLMENMSLPGYSMGGFGANVITNTY